MKFKGVDRKTALAMIVGYIVIAILIQFLFDMRISMIFVAIGMILSGAMGIRNKSYAILSQAAISQNGNLMNGFMLYMNYLLLFLGAVIIIQQF